MLKNVKHFVKEIIALQKLNCQLNTIINEEIKEAKRKIKEQENESKVLFFEYKQED